MITFKTKCGSWWKFISSPITLMFILMSITGCNDDASVVESPEANQRYIVVGHVENQSLDGRAYSSTDAVNWTDVTPSDKDGDLHGIAYGNGIFVAIGLERDYSQKYKVWICRTTNGGKDWDKRDPPQSAWGSTFADNIQFGNGTFIVVGYNSVSLNLTGYLWHSTDGGITWYAKCPNNCRRLDGVTYGNGNFVAAGLTENNAAVWYSQDGMWWNICKTFYNSEYINHIGFGNGRYVGVGYNWLNEDGLAWYSDNLNDWTEVQAPWGWQSYCVQNIDYGNNLWFASCNMTTYVSVSSNNGANWQSVNLGGTGYINNVRFCNGLYIAVGYNRILTSTDGSSWNETALPGVWWDVTYGE